ncbi:MAG TPA: TraB/GumN family protein [Thiohalobacter sp.]|nr:TraB/GumN family protein [Thiohalobacter sp.]
MRRTKSDATVAPGWGVTLIWLLLGLAWLLPVGAEAQGRLWRISAAGVEPSYLFGTMHSEHPEVIRLPPAVERALVGSRRLVLEMVLDQTALLSTAQAGLFESGRDLADVLPPALYRRTVAAMADYGVPEPVLRRFKPWMVFSTLMLPRSRTGMFLDLRLYQQAVAAGKPVTGLETAAEQIAVFDGMSMDDQVSILRDTLDNLERFETWFEEMRRVYLSGDLEALERFSDDMMHDIDPALAQRFQTRFVSERNHRMVARLRPLLRRGGAFIAVGALHLPGEDGLIALLREAGYEVERE